MTTRTPELAEPKMDSKGSWQEALLLYRLYSALSNQFQLSPVPYPENSLAAATPSDAIAQKIFHWFDQIDGEVRAYQIRQLPPDVLNANSASLTALVQRYLRKANKTVIDRDKIDLLLVQYFALSAPQELYRGEIALSDVARVLRPVIPEADATPLEWCAPLEQMLANVERCASLRDLMEQGILEQGRMLKDSADCMFYDPAALVAFCRFNFLVRRAFIRLLHADLQAMRSALDSLEKKAVRSVDCRRAGFSAAEKTAKVRHFCENWQQPFKKDYTENSVNKSFEQLLALRADLEDAVVKSGISAQPSTEANRRAVEDPTASIEAEQIAMAQQALQVEEKLPKAAPRFNGAVVEEPTHFEPVQTQSATKNSAPKVEMIGPDECLESIWEQLIAAPPSRGRSMSTVVLKDTKVLLSSWEVAAFVSQDSEATEDLRRAVVARAMLGLAIEERKRSGDDSGLVSALGHSRSEVSYFQGRIEQSKAAKDTEAAVNLGISTKRLLSLMEEAEALQP